MAVKIEDAYEAIKLNECLRLNKFLLTCFLNTNRSTNNIAIPKTRMTLAVIIVHNPLLNSGSILNFLHKRNSLKLPFGFWTFSSVKKYSYTDDLQRNKQNFVHHHN